MAESRVVNGTNGLIVHGPVGDISGKRLKGNKKGGGPGRT